MAAVTDSRPSLHLGMTSKYHIAAFCPKREKNTKKRQPIISPLKPTAGPLQLPLVNVTRHPPAAAAIYTQLWSLAPFASLCFMPPVPVVSAWLVWAGSDLLCGHNPAVIHLLFTLHSLSPLLEAICLSARQLCLPFVKVFLPVPPLNVSV